MERRHGEYLEMFKRDTEEEQRDTEEEARQAQEAAAQPAPDINVVWNTTFPWAGPAPTLIDLTGPDDDEDVQGSAPPHS